MREGKCKKQDLIAIYTGSTELSSHALTESRKRVKLLISVHKFKNKTLKLSRISNETII